MTSRPRPTSRLSPLHPPRLTVSESTQNPQRKNNSWYLVLITAALFVFRRRYLVETSVPTLFQLASDESPALKSVRSGWTAGAANSPAFDGGPLRGRGFHPREGTLVEHLPSCGPVSIGDAPCFLPVSLPVCHPLCSLPVLMPSLFFTRPVILPVFCYPPCFLPVCYPPCFLSVC